MKLAAIVCAFLSWGVFAQKISTKIVHIKKPLVSGEFYEVFVSHNGRVYEVDPEQKDLLHKLYTAKETGATAVIEVEQGEHFHILNLMETITSVETVSHKKSGSLHAMKDENLDPMSGYAPSNVAGLAEAKRMFGRLYDKNKWFNQCFNRAHIWSKQMHDHYGVKSMKILIYYTQKYRKNVDKKWWFHIAPMINVNGEHYVMDKKFTKQPLMAADWENVFTEKLKRPYYNCKKIKNISEYYESSNYYNEYCNIQHTSMYYWEPNDMEALDEKGVQKTKWVDWEIKAAAKEAFKDWREIYKRHRAR